MAKLIFGIFILDIFSISLKKTEKICLFISYKASAQ